MLIFNECVKQFANYKILPKEKRVSSYLFKLKQELIMHILVGDGSVEGFDKDFGQ